MNLRTATSVATVGTTLALVVRLGMFGQQLLTYVQTYSSQLLITTTAYCVGDVLLYVSLLIFFFSVRRSLGPGMS
jgi:hypothetical protein